MNEQNKVLWHNADAISYFSGYNHNAKYVFNGETGSSSADLDLTTAGKDDIALKVSYGAYPYNEKNKVQLVDGEEILSVMYPSEQTYAESSFGKGANVMVAAGLNTYDKNLYFRNACGYLIIKLSSAIEERINSIKLTALGGVKIAGEAHIVAKNDAEPVITMTENATSVITMDCNNLVMESGKTYEFWFALPPVTLTDGIEILVDANMAYSKKFIKKTTKSIEIQRNVPQPMSVLEFTRNTPLNTQLWYRRSGDNNATGKGFEFTNNDFNAVIVTSQTFFDSQLGYHVVTLAEPMTAINNGVFEGKDITKVILPETLQTIGESVFEGCENLTEITIPGSVTSIGDNAFYECYSLNSVTFKSGSEPLYIGYQDGFSADEGPFYTSPLTYIYLDRDLRPSEEYTGEISEWDEGIFAHKQSVASTTVKLGHNVKTIHNFMFAHLPITSLTIPGSVNTIGNNVFDGCENLTHLIYEPSPTGESLTHGYNDDGDDDGLFIDSPLIEVSLNREINYTFGNIGNAYEGLFGNKPSLTTVTLGEQVKTLHPYMFAGSSITSITIPAAVDYIHEYVFDDCESLAELTFAASETALIIKGQGDSEGPFYDSPLTTINYNRNFDYKELDGDEMVPSADKHGIFAISKTAKNKVSAENSTVNIGSLIESIPNRMFCNLPITTLTIPGTVNAIGNDVFNGCSRLATLTFSPSETTPATALTLGYNTDGEQDGPFLNSPITTLSLNREIDYVLASAGLDADDEGVFSGRPLTMSVTLGEQVRTLHPYMFAASGITSITIPSTLKLIDDFVFYNCTDLSTITFTESADPLKIGFQAWSDEKGPFYQSPLTEINLYRQLNPTDDYATSLDQSDEGIFSCGNRPESYTELKMNDNVTSISDYMFYGQNLKMITIPKTVTTIGKEAFADNPNLYWVLFQHENVPPTLGEDVFEDHAENQFNLIFYYGGVREAAQNSSNWPKANDKTFYSVSNPQN